MLDDIRKKTKSGFDSLSKPNPDEVGAAVIGKAKEAAERLSGLAVGIIEWSTSAREHLLSDIRDVVARTVDEMRLAKGSDLEALAQRVARLEKASSGRARSSGAGAGTRGRSSKAKAATTRTKKPPAKDAPPSADR